MRCLPRATGTQIVHIHRHEHVSAAIGYPHPDRMTRDTAAMNVSAVYRSAW